MIRGRGIVITMPPLAHNRVCAKSKGVVWKYGTHAVSDGVEESRSSHFERKVIKLHVTLITRVKETSREHSTIL